MTCDSMQVLFIKMCDTLYLNEEIKKNTERVRQQYFVGLSHRIRISFYFIFKQLLLQKIPKRNF